MRLTLTDALQGAFTDADMNFMEAHISDSLPEEGRALINAYPTHQSVLGEAIDPSLPATTEALAFYEYVHPDAPHDKQFIRLVTSNIDTLYAKHFLTLLAQLNARIDMQATCSHDYIRPCDPEGATYQDGRGICVRCGLKNQYAFLPEPGGIISMSHGPDYASRHPWATGTYVQGGTYASDEVDEGYDSAFIEAFPVVGTVETYLRADAATVAEAEAKAYAQYQRQLACPEHVWSREVSGTHRTDGYARCTECGLTGRALPPETTCTVCNTPTKHDRLGEHLCLTHYMDVPAETRAERLAARYHAMKGGLRETSSYEQLLWRYRIEEQFRDTLYTSLKGNAYASHSRKLDNLIRFALRAILSQRYGIRTIAAISGHPPAERTPAPASEAMANDLCVVHAMIPELTNAATRMLTGEKTSFSATDLFTDPVRDVCARHPAPGAEPQNN